MDFVILHCVRSILRSKFRNALFSNYRTQTNQSWSRSRGCESKVSEEKLKMTLSHWGSVTTEIKEEVFLDPDDNEGTNRKGVYIFSMIH